MSVTCATTCSNVCRSLAMDTYILGLKLLLLVGSVLLSLDYLTRPK